MLTAISPIDGRYEKQTLELREYFSEFALINYRVKVEYAYFLALCEANIGGLQEILPINPELANAINNFDEGEAEKIKSIEKTTNHDVKAVEYYLRELFTKFGIGDHIEFIHFGLTSQDINNTAFPLMLKEATQKVMLPCLDELIYQLRDFSEKYAGIPMLAHTHGQPASPTSFKKEMLVFVERLENQRDQLKAFKFDAKFGGATGNFNAHVVTYPDVNWKQFADHFIQSLGLNRLQTTTQIAHYDNEAAYFHLWIRVNSILVDFCRDIWAYISMNYIKQKTVANEVGSSAMPHKVNPIDFENAEGNLMLANALFGFLAEKLPVSRLQRDLTDSTVMRNIGVPMSHVIIACKSLIKGLGKLSVDQNTIEQDLNDNIAVIAEGIQCILRRENVEHPYELLKNLTRGKGKLTPELFLDFIQSLPVNDKIKEELKAITPSNYIGYAE